MGVYPGTFHSNLEPRKTTGRKGFSLVVRVRDIGCRPLAVTFKSSFRACANGHLIFTITAEL